MTDQPEKMPLTSMDIAAEKREALKQLFPEVFAEDRIDFDQLKRVLGDWVEPGKERFGLTWPGKAECMRIIQSPSVATLKPVREESVNFDETENVFIEGDNLEVLKLLQKAYFGKVKMIYIDPPYNTGNEFIYPDNFSETLETYLAYSGQSDETGKRFSTNADTGGRYHSSWLSMMYPRLFLARNLLREDGAIFISIDDHEVAHLRNLCDQIFGEENFIASVIWQRVYSPKNSARFFSEDHDYVLVYARNAEIWEPTLLPRTEEANARYTNPDNDPRGPWKSSDLTARNYYSEGEYEIVGPTGRSFKPGRGRYWRQSKENFNKMNEDNRIWWGPNKDAMPAQKRFLSEVKQGIVPQTLWNYDLVGHTQDAKKELLKYVEFEKTSNVLNSVKPVRLLKHALKIGTSPESEDIILDFFAGSGPLAHAVLSLNSDDGGNRKYVLVQLPEPLPEPEAKLKTISDLAKSRIYNVGKEISEKAEQELDLSSDTEVDVGMKVYSLTTSNLRQWSGEPEGLTEELNLHVQNVDPSATPEDIVYELLLKAGFPLTTKVTAREMAGKTVYSIEDGALLICLDKEITPALIDALAEADPLQVICLDEGFKGNDQLKANAVQTFKARAASRETEIVFRTV